MKLPGTATKDEYIYIALGKLNIKPGHVFFDIGCGSGKVSEHAARFTDRIFGIDRRAEAVEASSRRVPFGRFIHGETQDILPTLPNIDRCFIGGTRNISEVLPMVKTKANPGCIIVVDLARIGIASHVVSIMKSQKIFHELIQIQVSRGYDLAGDMALKPENPIFMVVGKC